MKKRRVLKSWVEKVCLWVVSSYFMFIVCTIETINNPINSIITWLGLVVMGGLITLPCLYLLIKYTKLFDEE